MGEEAADHGGHGLADLDDVPVGVVKAQGTLAPGMLPDWMHKPDGHGFRLFREPVQVLGLKIQLSGVVGQGDRTGFQKALPGIQGLQSQAAGQRDVGA